MVTFKAWYKKNPTFVEDDSLTVDNLQETHVLVKEVEAWGLEKAYKSMQGEVWSPNGEARDLIISLGLSHTSMSVGDVLEDDNGKFHEVSYLGFRPLT